MSIFASTSTKPVVIAPSLHKAKTAGDSTTTSFAGVVAREKSGTPFTDTEVKEFFASNPDQEAIANQAASLGLNREQIVKAMQTAGYGGTDPSVLRDGIDTFMSTHSDTFAWAANGSVANTSKSSPAAVNATLGLSKVSMQQMKAQSATWTSQGMTISEQADRARAAGVDGLTLSKFMSDNRNAPIADLYPTGLTGIIDKTGRNIPLAEVKAFFATSPSNDTMYKTWDGMGLNANQMQHLMAIKNGVQYVPTGSIGKYDYAGNYTDPYYGSDAFTGGGTINGSPTGNRYGDASTKLST